MSIRGVYEVFATYVDPFDGISKTNRVPAVCIKADVIFLAYNRTPSEVYDHRCNLLMFLQRYGNLYTYSLPGAVPVKTYDEPLTVTRESPLVYPKFSPVGNVSVGAYDLYFHDGRLVSYNNIPVAYLKAIANTGRVNVINAIVLDRVVVHSLHPDIPVGMEMDSQIPFTIFDSTRVTIGNKVYDTQSPLLDSGDIIRVTNDLILEEHFTVEYLGYGLHFRYSILFSPNLRTVYLWISLIDGKPITSREQLLAAKKVTAFNDEWFQYTMTFPECQLID